METWMKRLIEAQGVDPKHVRSVVVRWDRGGPGTELEIDMLARPVGAHERELAEEAG